MKMTSHERVLRALTHREADRVPRTESFWPETIPLWREQGMPPRTDPWEEFDFDINGAGWVNHEAHPGRRDVLAEDEERVTFRDGHGALLRYWKNKSGTPEHIAFTVDSRTAWGAHREAMMAVPVASRVNTAYALEQQTASRRRNLWFAWTGVECFEMAKDILGHETLCMAMLDDPDWIADVLMALTRLALRALDHLEASGIRFDGAWMYGDIAYNHGPFVSPRLYRELVAPAHAEHLNWFRQRGLPVIYHTDGDFRSLIPALLDNGVSCFQPLEAKAGLDVRELKRDIGGSVALMGNIDATVLVTNDRDAIEAEIASKVPVAMRGGGYIYHSDHSIPPDVTWRTYRFLMERLEQYGRYDS